MKRKILIVVNPGITGVEYHRQLIPHYYLNDHNKNDFEVSQINEIESVTDQFLSSFQLVQFSRAVSYAGHTQSTLQRLRRLGIVSVLDIDDYWQLPSSHLMSRIYTRHRIGKQMLESVKYADHITTTTPFFAGVIQQVNPAVTVLPNAIDPAQPQFRTQPNPSSKIRFGWVGGVCHLEDIRLMQSGFEKLNSDAKLQGRYQLYLMGFNTKDESGMYPRFEKIFTTRLAENDDTYYRINTANVYSYAQGYNLFDVALAPLVHNMFNCCKSELKMIEAGFMKKAMIVSDTGPYKHIARPGINCLTVKDTNYKSAWYLSMKKLIQNPNLAEDLAGQLHEEVTETYHINKVNKTRADLYKTLIDKK